ncbi:uncharacterized protein LOC122954064 isoform X3 [Acropora millepora]|uniref:uncharacterized protein LOC122954064 isoform X3 n=1 Tax=Acropora millepora TaxID=45264 RepID=UPI001CF4EFAB|nr:uncharacterized protein LOC122954064 isoform X3 [Acropora millepora]
MTISSFYFLDPQRFMKHRCDGERIIYDDACHMKKYCVNPVQQKVTAVSKRLGKMDMVVDKLQSRNHVDLWCKGNCNPHDQNELRERGQAMMISVI